jgi:hypothetical protein
MSALAVALDAYLALRRGLGTALLRPGASLRRFVDFLDREGAAIVTTELALRWATAPAGCDPGHVGEASGRRPPLRPLATGHRSPDPGATPGAVARPLPPAATLHLP